MKTFEVIKINNNLLEQFLNIELHFFDLPNLILKV